MSPLHCAAINGHVGVTKLLLEKGAKVNAKDKVRDRTPKREKARKREKERCVRGRDRERP